MEAINHTFQRYLNPDAGPISHGIAEAIDLVLTNLAARATGGGAPFSGTINTVSDLEDLVTTAWGESQFGSHRGHAPIEAAPEAFLSIEHDLSWD